MLNSLRIQGFRAFRDLEIAPLGRVNLLVGRNNIGKTTVLEAVQLYAQGRGALAAMARILRDREELVRSESEGRPALDAVRLFHRPKGGKNTEEFRIGPDQGDVLTVRLAWSRMVESSEGDIKRELVEADQAEGAEESLILQYQGSRRMLPVSRLSRSAGASVRPEPSESSQTETCYLGARGLPSGGAARLWDATALTDDEGEVLEALRLIEPTVSAITFVQGRSDRIPLIRRNGQPAEPMRALGDGMNRLFELALCLVRARGSYLLVDEPENGVHHSVLPDIWRLIFTTATRLNVQVFAATHSLDCIRAFEQAASAHPEHGMIIRLDRKGEEVRAVTFTEAEMAIALQEEIEIR